ncbi:type II toxin-antitoxin system RelE family toxin [Aquimarina macrocephali]|uniref:type II toxin-antitoxin system RelE family toxin n=1 Tax=Aquimarina macrocephali TaxID=666563 RepID=UPI000463DCC7|nr:type II toxin-antitoxin system RelE/ParE family toxin [Aquimarina macrocephali]
MTFRIEYLSSVISKDIPKLPKSAKALIKKAIETRLTLDPVSYGKPLRYGLSGQRRLRVSDYRIIYTIDHDENIVIINTIKHRKDVYD